MKPLKFVTLTVVATFFAGLVLSACSHLEDKRTPPAAVWIAFNTEQDWNTYGTPSALDHKTFIKGVLNGGLPQTATMQTGFGGVLLVGDILGNPIAYEMACPVENKKDVTIKVDNDINDAYCPKCKSRYSIYSNYGIPTSGKALEYNYGLTKYSVISGPNGEYRVITR